jgi:phosphoesterase RecJ-like protein
MINTIFKEEELQLVFAELTKAKNIVIVSHKSPDGDAVGSSLAFQQYLTLKGFESTVVLPDGFPKCFSWIEGADEIKFFDKPKDEAKELLEEADIIFTLDFNDQSRVGYKMGDLLAKSIAFKVMIDHHQDPKNYADVTFSDAESCSTAQLIYEFIEANGDLSLLNKSTAEAIYTGIMTDTGSFRFSSTTSKTHEIAGKLIDLGLSQSEIHEEVYDVNTPDRLQLLGYTLNNKMELLPEIGVAIISLTTEEMHKFNTLKGYTEGFVNYALSIQGIKVGVFVKEDTDMVKVSFRSKGSIPVNEFSKLNFEGGGHINAAGGKSDTSVQDTVTKIKSLIPQFMAPYIETTKEVI